MRTAESYLQVTPEEPFDAIVIGSGIGGLSAASLLARHGERRVLVLEKHYTLGGFTHTFRRPGYEWDVGVHYIGDVRPGTMLRALFDEVSGDRLEWADMGEIYDRVILGDLEFDFPKGGERLRQRLIERFPREQRGIDAYFDLLEKVGRSTQYFFMEKALPPLVAKIAGPFLRRSFLRYARRPTREVLESLIQDPRLIGILTTQWGDYGLPPARSSFGIHAIVAGHYLGGGFYPVGGAGRIAETILPVISGTGGQALVRAEVEEIVVEEKRAVGVRMAKDGRVIRAPLIISDAGVLNTFHKLLARDLTRRLGLLERLENLESSMSHLCLYVGLNKTAEALDLPRSNLWIYPDEDHDKTFSAIRQSDWERPFFYISFPSAKDPDFERRCPGRATIDVITGASYDAFALWENTRWQKRGADYEKLKESQSERLLEILYRHLPQVRGEVERWELSTPLTTRHFANYTNGEIYGLAHTPKRFEQRWLRPRTPIRGLYLTGQDVATCGVSGALIGGALAASAILGRNLLGRITKERGAKQGLAVPQ